MDQGGERRRLGEISVAVGLAPLGVAAVFRAKATGMENTPRVMRAFGHRRLLSTPTAS